MPAPRFGVADRPRDILDGSGRWLAAELGWRWVKSRGAVEIRQGSRSLRLGLEPSTWNRSGVATWVSTRVTVFDDDLVRWREAWPDSTLFHPSATSILPSVYNSLLINVEGDLAEIECSGLRPRMLGLDEFAARFRARVLAVLDLFQSPHLVAQDLPGSWLKMVDCGTIEWALAHEDRDAAALLLRRHLEHPLPDEQSRIPMLERFRQGWELAPDQEGLPHPMVLSHPKALGWLARVHNLLDPATLPQSMP